MLGKTINRRNESCDERCRYSILRAAHGPGLTYSELKQNMDFQGIASFPLAGGDLKVIKAISP